MTWFASSTNEAESQKEHAHMFLAVDLDFTSGHVRAWTGVGELTISGSTFYGLGNLGKITIPADRAGLDASKKSFQLSGIDPTILSEADIEACFGRSAIEYIGFLNPDTKALTDTPEINWEGRMDNVRRVDGNDPTIEVNAEHRLILLDESDAWRYTHEHQQQFYAGDLGFDQVRAIQLKEIIWGSQRSIIGYNPGPHHSKFPVYGG
jgi:hypothetical protein